MITIVGIARKARVSHAVVSSVLNGQVRSIRVGDRTRRRILQLAEKHGYRRNDIARAMVTGRSRAIGFVTPTLSAEFYGEMLEGVLKAADREGYSTRVLWLDQNDRPQTVARKCAELRLEGLVCTHLDLPTLEVLHAELTRYRILLLTVDNAPYHPFGIRVLADEEQGIAQAVQHLATLGHSRIAFISGATRSGFAILREQGYRQAMERLNLPIRPGYLAHGDWGDVGTEPEVRNLLECPDRPTAMVCASDWIALAVLRTARALGFPVPQALSVVGFANLIACNYADPPLTTVKQPFEDMGQEAVRQLFAQLQKPAKVAAGTAAEIKLPTQLVIRKSTAPPPAAISP